jgi:hypothetical protein
MIAKLKYTIFIVLILITMHMNGQEMLGLGFSTYSGISGKNINPAFLTGSKVYLDVNLVGAGISAENNFGYIPRESGTIWSILRGDSLSYKYGAYTFNNFYEIHNKPYHNFAVMATVMGPGVMLQDGKQAFGVSLSFRSYQSAYHFPGLILRDIYNQGPVPADINQEHTFHNFGMASLSWAELSFNYAYDFYERYGDKLTAGIELKVLYGVEGFYSTTDTYKYKWTSYNTVQVDSLNTAMGMALPVDYNGTGANLKPWDKGHGLGLNLGILYTKNESNVSLKGEKQLCARPYEDYKYKIGFSIMDIGSIRFKNNARLYDIQAGGIATNQDQMKFYNTITGTMDFFSNLFLGDSTKALKDSTISMSLPTALSLQVDYHLKKDIYIGGLWIHPLRFNKRSLRRPAQLAVIPRYDTRMLGVSVPVSLYDYQQLRMGLALRIYTITIGTEKLGTLLGMGKLSGLDFYFNIKLHLEKGTCLSWKKGACSE